MAHYRIAAHGRHYYTDADDIATALAYFAANIEGIATETLMEIGGPTEAQNGQTAGATVLPSPARKPKRRSAR